MTPKTKMVHYSRHVGSSVVLKTKGDCGAYNTHGVYVTCDHPLVTCNRCKKLLR